MPKLIIYKPEGICREDTSTDIYYIAETLVDLGCDPTEEGIEIRFFVPKTKASWYGELKLTPSQAEKLREDIDLLLKKYEPFIRVNHSE